MMLRGVLAVGLAVAVVLAPELQRVSPSTSPRAKPPSGRNDRDRPDTSTTPRDTRRDPDASLNHHGHGSGGGVPGRESARHVSPAATRSVTVEAGLRTHERVTPPDRLPMPWHSGLLGSGFAHIPLRGQYRPCPAGVPVSRLTRWRQTPRKHLNQASLTGRSRPRQAGAKIVIRRIPRALRCDLLPLGLA